MSIEKELQARSQSKCELCGNEHECSAYPLPSSPGHTSQYQVWVCSTCKSQIEKPDTADANHWRFLNDTIWSEIPAVQVLSWRMLHKLKHIDWVPDLLDIAYLDDDTLEWAKASGDDKDLSDIEKHVDCYGAELQHGDSVVLVKTLDVKGATFSAKLGTVVRKIRLVDGNIEQIEGKVNGSQIVILTKYVRKASPKDD